MDFAGIKHLLDRLNLKANQVLVEDFFRDRSRLNPEVDDELHGPILAKVETVPERRKGPAQRRFPTSALFLKRS
jgi:hypothetical protein